MPEIEIPSLDCGAEHILILLPPSPQLEQAIEQLQTPERQVRWVLPTQLPVFDAPIPIDLVVMDLQIPQQVIAPLLRHAQPPACLVVVAQPTQLPADYLRQRLGDFISCPWSSVEMVLRIQSLLSRRRRYLQEKFYTMGLENRVNARTEEVWEKTCQLKEQFIAAIEALIRALQAKHRYTEGHSRRVAEISVKVARQMALGYQEIRDIELAALFHDIGKLGIRDEVLNKPGRLTPAEFEHIKDHPLIAEKILSPFEELQNVSDMVVHEHERFDGKGYPYQIAGEDIPIGSRIIAVADAYDALTSNRAYRQGTDDRKALEEIQKNAGTQFDPRVVAAFAEVLAMENNMLKEKVEKVMSEQVKPYLQSHGGDVELVDVTEDGIVKVRLQGACGQCPGAIMTLQGVVLEALKQNIPEVQQVVLA